jgi:hypothetical protein
MANANGGRDSAKAERRGETLSSRIGIPLNPSGGSPAAIERMQVWELEGMTGTNSLLDWIWQTIYLSSIRRKLKYPA